MKLRKNTNRYPHEVREDYRYAVSVDGLLFPLVWVSVAEMERIIKDEERSKLVGYPHMIAKLDSSVFVWPAPVRSMELVEL